VNISVTVASFGWQMYRVCVVNCLLRLGSWKQSRGWSGRCYC